MKIRYCGHWLTYSCLKWEFRVWSRISLKKKRTLRSIPIFQNRGRFGDLLFPKISRKSVAKVGFAQGRVLDQTLLSVHCWSLLRILLDPLTDPGFHNMSCVSAIWYQQVVLYSFHVSRSVGILANQRSRNSLFWNIVCWETRNSCRSGVIGLPQHPYTKIKQPICC